MTLQILRVLKERIKNKTNMFFHAFGVVTEGRGGSWSDLGNTENR